MIALGRDPVLTHVISYLRSATKGPEGSFIFTSRGFTGIQKEILPVLKVYLSLSIF